MYLSIDRLKTAACHFYDFKFTFNITNKYSTKIDWQDNPPHCTKNEVFH